MTAPDAAASRSPLTVQGWQILVLGTMGVLVLVGGVAGAILMNRTDDVSRQLIDQIQPARSAAYRLQAALRDQETAIRGYAISADRQFLDAVLRRARDAEAAAADDFRSASAGAPSWSPTSTRSSRRAPTWRTPYRRAPDREHHPRASRDRQNTPSVERGKAEFDHIRTLFDAQNQHLIGGARAQASTNLDHVRRGATAS